MFSLRRIWVEDILQSLPETGVHALPVIKVKGARITTRPQKCCNL